jgi:hypothetical protein
MSFNYDARASTEIGLISAALQQQFRSEFAWIP